MLLGGVFGAGVAAVAVSAVTLFTATGFAASQAKPANTNPPTISGTPQQGKTLTGDRGDWGNAPTDFNYAWLRCDENGGTCAVISGAHALRYTLTSADVANTLRFRATAINADGRTSATSVPTAVVTKAAAPPPATTTPSRGNGCPTGSGNPDQVSAIAPPARLIVDQMQSNPGVLTSGTQTVVVRFHVSSTCQGSVQGALVYATATPFQQWSIPPEGTTGSDGWAELRFQRLSGFPVSPRQQLIAMFVRARKPGEGLLVGVSTRRLVSLRVNLHA